MRALIAALAVVAAMCNCSTPNMFIRSRCEPEVKFNKHERIMLAPPKDARPDELALMPQIKALLEEKEFTLVDTISEADRLLSFEVLQDVKWQSIEYILPTSGGLKTIGGNLVPPSEYGGSVISSEKTGYDMFYLFMYDLNDVSQGKNGVVWGGMISTESKYFEQDIGGIIKRTIELYGKDRYDRGRFKMSRKN